MASGYEVTAMKVFLIGGTGLVGSAYARLFAASGITHHVITRANYGDFLGQSCDVLVNANGNSSKVLATREPLTDFDASVRSVRMSLEDFRASKYVFLSSGDVYPRQDSPSATHEDQPLPVTGMSGYGFHKYLAETMVRHLHPDWIVMRMGGFVGPGLKKNAIFDMLHDMPVWMRPESELQFISTDSAARIVWTLVQRGISKQTINLGALGRCRIGDIHQRLASKSPFQPEASAVSYELSLTKLASQVGDLPSTRDEVERFLTSLGR